MEAHVCFALKALPLLGASGYILYYWIHFYVHVYCPEVFPILWVFGRKGQGCPWTLVMASNSDTKGQ